MLNREQKEDLRHAALVALAIRAPAALSLRQVFHAVKKEVPFLFEEADLTAALSLLVALTPEPMAKASVDFVGSSVYWSATPAAVLHVERGEV